MREGMAKGRPWHCLLALERICFLCSSAGVEMLHIPLRMHRTDYSWQPVIWGRERCSCAQKTGPTKDAKAVPAVLNPDYKCSLPRAVSEGSDESWTRLERCWLAIFRPQLAS